MFDEGELNKKEITVQERKKKEHLVGLHTVSMVVEFRAVWGYRLYQEALVRAGSIVSLKSLLAEESGHLTDMAERLRGLGELDGPRLRGFCAIETALYRRLLDAFAGTPEYRRAA